MGARYRRATLSDHRIQYGDPEIDPYKEGLLLGEYPYQSDFPSAARLVRRSRQTPLGPVFCNRYETAASQVLTCGLPELPPSQAPRSRRTQPHGFDQCWKAK